MNNATSGKAGKSTIYFQGGYGMVKLEVRSVEFIERPYAQYSAAYEIRFVKKGARKQVGTVVCDHPSHLIVEGWDHPEVDSAFGAAVETENGTTVAMGRYSSCDPRWLSDFDAKINPYLERTGAKVVLDIRGHNPHRSRATGELVAV